MSTLTITNSFSPGATIQSSLMNANFTAISTWANGQIDNGNVGTLGFYASQIIPTNTAQATFGGTSAYTLPAGLNFAGTTANAITSATTGAVTAFNFNNNAGTPTTGALATFQSGGATKVTISPAGVTTMTELLVTGQTVNPSSGQATFGFSTDAIVRVGSGKFQVQDGSGTAWLVLNATTCLSPSFTASGAAPTTSAGQVAFGGGGASTVGAAGGASALPATPLGYLIANVAGTQVKIPYYNN